MKSIFALAVLAITVVALPITPTTTPIEVEDVPGKHIHLKRNPVLEGAVNAVTELIASLGGVNAGSGVLKRSPPSPDGIAGSLGGAGEILNEAAGSVSTLNTITGTLNSVNNPHKRQSPASLNGVAGSLGGAGEILNEVAGSVSTLNGVTGTLNSINNPHKRQSPASLNGIAGSLGGVVQTLGTATVVLDELIEALGGLGLRKRSSPSPAETAESLGEAGEVVNEVAGSVNTLNGVTETANSINHPQKRQSPASLNGIAGSLGGVVQTLNTATVLLNGLIRTLEGATAGLPKRSSLSPAESAGSFGGASETLNEVVGSMEFTDLDGVTGTVNSINNPHKRSPGLNGVQGENLEKDLENKIKIGALGNTLLG